MNEQTIAGNTYKLALKFELSQTELEILCQRFASLEVGEELSAGLKAVGLVRMVKQALDYKFENITIEEKHVFQGAKEAPAQDMLKAKIVRGLFLTFIEYQRGLPGFFSIISGIGAAGFGLSSFQIAEIPEKLKISELKEVDFAEGIILKAQADFFNSALRPEVLSGFNNIRSGVYCQIVGCALIPVYAAALKKTNQENLDDVHIVQKALEMVQTRFSPDSEKLQRFTSQNLFRIIFEELFNYESTVYSIYA